MKFTLISPTFKRPDEVTEFLESLLSQNHHSFEVILGDGTPGDTLRPELKRFESNGHYPLTIVYEEYLSVSDGRNRAAEHAKGEYIIFLDSDCIIPENYLNNIEDYLKQNPLDAFGGPDAAHKDFTTLQKAISYSMTSIFTTGGIRGKKNHVGAYHPRGFNMGMKRSVFEAVGGYSEFRCGEDIELSIRIIKAGYKVGLIEEAFVYHKRRTSLKQFFKQVFRFGAARINIYKRHKEELKLTHMFPFAFLLFMITVVVLQFTPFTELALYAAGAFAAYLVAIFAGALLESQNIGVAFLSIATSITMLSGYGWGFFRNWWAYNIAGKEGGLKL